MPPQQGDNEEEAAPNKSGPGSKGGADDSDDEDVTTVRVVHRKGKGADDDALVVSPAVAVEEDGVEAELRATKAMAHYCFAVLLHHFRGGEPPLPTFDTGVECPLFVTWEKEQPHHQQRTHHLRGCIGTLSPRPLEALQDYVHSSAFRDRRFPPIAEHEVPSLRCSVSLLVRYEEAAHAWDWQVGRHGIILAFKCPAGSGRSYSATYLPEVAREQRWSKGEALESLVRKAGYNGKLTEAFWSRVALTRYQSSKATLAYADFLAYPPPPATADGGGRGGKRVEIR